MSKRGDNKALKQTAAVSGKASGSPQSAAAGAKATAQPAATLKQLSSLRMLFAFLPPYKGLLFGGVVALLASSGLTLGIVRSLEWLIDGGLSGDQQLLNNYFIGVFIAIILLGMAAFFRVYWVTLLGERVVADLRKAVHENLLALSPSYFESNRPAEIASRLTADTTLIQAAVGAAVPMALLSGIQATGGLALIVMYDPLLMLVALGLAIAIILPVSFFGRRIRRYTKAGQAKIAAIGTLANESYSAIQVIQAFSQEASELERFGERVEGTYQIAKKRIFARGMLTLMITTMVFSSLAGGLWFGVHAVLAGTLSGGELATLLGLGMLVATSLANLSEVFTLLQRASGSAARLSQLLSTRSDLPVADKPALIKQQASHHLALDNVCFSYPSKPGILALNEFSMTLEPGKMVAIVGQTGAGKSTVLQLLLRFFDPQSGSIKLDGVELRDYRSEELRSLFALVPQDVFIFADTVERNVRFGKLSATDEEVKAALDAAHCSEFVDALPNGIHTNLGERGVRLSGGQRQRLSIARALLRDAPILLLDEATSSLDSEVEQEVQAALDRLMKGRTTLVIAHRLSTIRKADNIVVIDEGRCVAQGKHEELLAEGGVYQRLAELQFADAQKRQVA
ncbi:MAG: hydrophobic compound transporter HcuC [Wenzhouxiangellaceae bacterium]